MIRTKNNPTTEAVAEIDHDGTAAEPNYIWERRSQG